MKAIWLREFGGPEVLVAGDADEPVAGPGQVMVEIAFVNVSFSETAFRATGRGPFPGDPPLIPGYGVGGTVTAVAEGADPALLGRRVVGGTRGRGAYAERVALDAASVVPLPDGLALDAAVALFGDGRTATKLTRTAAVQPGERILVEAAAGGVGTLLVQLARAAGATVIAAAGGQRKLALVRELGADVAVDYRQPGWTAQAGAVDVVFDGVGGELAHAAFKLLRPGGRMVSFGASSGRGSAVDQAAAAAAGVTLLRPGMPTPQELRADIDSALAEGAAGRLRVVIGQRFPLARAADAHAAIDARQTVGRTLLEVG
ncbi:zinc-binding dehydrogenase [Conexibacter sp. CPCC 206217]|uniref:zinc-binding dehydrogenase n=1 Tax=Conexibacter sp. CPCC 206217 TaxID=3064574 RepID=UPI00271A1583|nr:zinc-binding dehydrogenase [Conexibacter sp. CPCC 206217]MDO8212080.1 zinc-binding dehydrogenase [Conexibacter sp. CPCC 206217]